MSDDKRTRETLDALAELYLTGTNPGNAPPAPPVPSSTSKPATPHLLGGPRPIRMAPRLRPPAAPVRIPPSLKPLDPNTRRPPESFRSPIPLIDDDIPATLGQIHPHAGTHANTPAPDAPTLRLHRDDPEPFNTHGNTLEEIPPQRPDAALIPQAVFLGNLPGFGGPWLTQFAHHMATDGGAAVILHLDPDEVDLELITAQQSTPGQATGSSDNLLLAQWASESVRLNLVELLESLLHDAPVQANDWLFHFTTGEPAQIAKQAAPLGHWTWLCGADEAAVAAAVQQINAMVDSLPPAQRPALGVMIMGSDPDTAALAAQRIDRGVTAAVGIPVQFLGSRKQMGPVTLHRLGTFQEAAATDAAITFAIDHIPDFGDDQPAQTAAEPFTDAVAVTTPSDIAPPVILPPPAEPAPTSTISADMLDAVLNPYTRQADPEPTPAPAPPMSTAFAFNQPAPAPARTPRPTATRPPALKPSLAAAKPAAPQTTQAPAPVVAPRPVPAPAAMPPTAPAAQASFDLPELLDFMLSEIPGAIALEALCPRHPDARLVLDQDGTLHLGLHHAATTELASPLLKLIEVRAWAQEHLQILKLTQRQLRFNDTTPPAIHLFTDQARAATDLITRLGSTARLHLLQEVQLGEETAYLCTALN